MSEPRPKQHRPTWQRVGLGLAAAVLALLASLVVAWLLGSTIAIFGGLGAAIVVGYVIYRDS